MNPCLASILFPIFISHLNHFRCFSIKRPEKFQDTIITKVSRKQDSDPVLILNEPCPGDIVEDRKFAAPILRSDDPELLSFPIDYLKDTITMSFNCSSH